MVLVEQGNMLLSDGKTEIPKFCIAQINYSYAGMSFCRWTKLLFTNFGLPKIFSGDKTLQIWLSELVWRARAGQGNLILSHPPFLF